MIYRVAFTGRGAEYTRCFTSKEERDRFAESMRQAGYKVHTWEYAFSPSISVHFVFIHHIAKT